MQESIHELRKIEELEDQVNQALKRSRQMDESTKFDEQFFKQELKEMQERCFMNQQTMMRIEQKYNKGSDQGRESPMQKSAIKIMKQSGMVEQKNSQIQDLQRKVHDLERQLINRQTEDQMRIQQLEYDNKLLNDQVEQSETINLQKALDDLQSQYLELQEKLSKTMRHDQEDYDSLKQEYEEYQLLTQNIINQEEEYQRRICELEEELQQHQLFQQDVINRINKNDEVFQQRYRELKHNYQQQLDDQRRIMDQQIDELRDQNNELFRQLQNSELVKQQFEFEQQKHQQQSNHKLITLPNKDLDTSVCRSKSFSACGGNLHKSVFEQNAQNNGMNNGMNNNNLNNNKVSLGQYTQSSTKSSKKPQDYQAKPIKQINLSIEKENLMTDYSYSKGRSYSKENQTNPSQITYKQVAEQRQQILSKVPKPQYRR